MASKLSGVSRSTVNFLLGNIAGLLRLSAMPVGLIAVTYMLLQLGLRVTAGPTESLSTVSYGLAQVVRSGVAGIVALIVILMLWVMFFIQIQRFRLTGNAPLFWGSLETWRTTFRFSAFCILTVLLAPFLVILLHLLARGLAWNLGPQGPNEGASWITALNPLIAWLLAGTVLCRLAVGFPPLAIGKRSGALVGWRLSKGHTVGLSARALLPASFAFLAVFIALYPETLGIILSMVRSVLSLFFQMNLIVEQGEVVGIPEVSLRGVVTVAFFGILAVTTVAGWYVNVLFADIYLRLSGTGQSFSTGVPE